MPKWESLKKTARNQQLYEYYLKHKDDMSVRVMGKMFDPLHQISGARVHQIIKKMKEVQSG